MLGMELLCIIPPGVVMVVMGVVMEGVVMEGIVLLLRVLTFDAVETKDGRDGGIILRCGDLPLLLLLLCTDALEPRLPKDSSNSP